MRPNRLSIEWSPAALVAFHRLSMHAATTVDRAVIQFAETGEGRMEWVAPHYRLYAGSFDLPVVVDAESLTLSVLNIYRIRGTRTD